MNTITTRLQRLEHVHTNGHSRGWRRFITVDGERYLETTVRGRVDYRHGLGPPIGGEWTPEERARLIGADDLAAIERAGWRPLVVHYTSKALPAE